MPGRLGATPLRSDSGLAVLKFPNRFSRLAEKQNIALQLGWTF